MTRRDYNRLDAEQKAALRELVRDNPASVLGVFSEKKKGFSDLPLFAVEQKKLF